MDAVLETYGARGLGLWPVTEPADGRLLTLSGVMTSTQVGTALAVLVGYQAQTGADVPKEPGAALRQLLEADEVLAPGGLRLRDPASGSSLDPGCCCGLENWRDWLGLPHGDTPWLGHDPAPSVEHRLESVRFWPQGHAATPHPLTLRTDELPTLLEGVRQDLAGFLRLVAQWAATERAEPELAMALVELLDEALCVTEPLTGPVIDGAA